MPSSICPLFIGDRSGTTTLLFGSIAQQASEAGDRAHQDGQDTLVIKWSQPSAANADIQPMPAEGPASSDVETQARVLLAAVLNSNSAPPACSHLHLQCNFCGPCRDILQCLSVLGYPAVPATAGHQSEQWVAVYVYIPHRYAWLKII